MTPTVAADSPWAPLLGLLPPELGRSLGPWLDRLAAAVGPLRARARIGTGAPDGFDGLSLRGPYDRLVLSEWALADLLPEEFVRRAAQGEHAFYQLARRDEARAKTSVALFDPGPMQLGAPRLAQFAALLVLASRARQAGAVFGWATLQRPPESTDAAAGLRLGLDAKDLRDFLLGRTPFAPAAADLDAWFDRARRGDWEDLWIIGAPATIAPGRRLAGVKTPVGRIEVSDVFAPGVRALDVTLVRGAHRRALRLDLPDEALCLQLLRGGVAPAPKPPRPVALGRTPGVARPVSPPILLADGRKVAFLDDAPGVTVYTVPDAPSPKRARYRRYALEPNGTVLGLGWARRRLVLLTERDGALHLRDTDGDVFPAHASLRAFADPAEWGPAMRPASLARVDILSPVRATETPSLAFLDAAHRFIGLLPRGAAVLATHAWATASHGDSLRVLIDPTRDPALAPQRAFVCPPNAVAAVAPDGLHAANWYAFARPVNGALSVAQQTGAVTSALRPGDEVLGLAHSPALGLGLVLAVLAADRRTLRWVSGSATAPVLTVDRSVRHAALTPRGDRVAFVFDDGGVEVWALPNAVCLVRVAPP